MMKKLSDHMERKRARRILSPQDIAHSRSAWATTLRGLATQEDNNLPAALARELCEQG